MATASRGAGVTEVLAEVGLVAAVPARRSVMDAKVAVVTAVAVVFGAFVATASFGLTQAILNGRDLGVSIAHPGCGS